MTALAEPTNRVCPFVGPDSGAMSADSPRIASVAELLAAMEGTAWRAPRVFVVRGLDRVRRVHVAVPKVEAFWTPDQARMAAATLDADQAFPGAAGVAADLRAAADAADRRNPLDGPLAPGQRRRPRGTGARFILTALILALCGVAAWALHTLSNGAAL